MGRPSSLAPNSLPSSTLPGGAAARAGSRLDRTSREACGSPLASRSTSRRHRKPRTALVDQDVYGGGQSVVHRWRASLSARLGGLAKDFFAQRVGRLTSITQARSTRRPLVCSGPSSGAARSARRPSPGPGAHGFLRCSHSDGGGDSGGPARTPGPVLLDPLLPAQVESTVSEFGQSAAKKVER